MDNSIIGIYIAVAIAVCTVALYFLTPSATPAMASAAAATPAPPAAPVDLVIADLAEHNGLTAGKDLWVAADGFVFNVEAGRDFYGPGSSYAAFSGRDATIGLATMEVDPAKWLKHSVAELSAAEVDTLGSWVNRFRMKYRIVGFLNDGANPMTVAAAKAKGLTQ